MITKHRIAAIVTAASLVAGLLGLAAAGPASAGPTLAFDIERTNLQVPGAAPSTIPSPREVGDRWYLREEVTEHGRRVGYTAVDCVVLFNEDLLCTNVTALDGRGDLMGHGLIRGGARLGGNPVFDMAVTGGTHEFANARGDVHLSYSTVTTGHLVIRLA